MSADNEATDETSIEQPSVHQSKSQQNSDSQGGAEAFGSPEARDAIPNRNQRGVQDVEAVTMTWSKGTLIAMFIKYVSSNWKDSPLV
jgi:hypothetical protein